LGQRLQRENVYALYDGGFLGVCFRYGNRLQPDFARRQRSGQCASHGPDTSVERELAYEQAFVELLAEELSHAAGQAQGHWQIKPRAFLADIGGCEIDGHTLAVGKFISAISHGRFDALAAFFYGIVWQPHDVEVGHARRTDIHFGLNKVGVNSIDRSAERLEKHRYGADSGCGPAGGARNPARSINQSAKIHQR
jgi:hypothetical protein